MSSSASSSSANRPSSTLIDLDDSVLDQVDQYFRAIPPVENIYECVMSSDDDSDENCKIIGRNKRKHVYQDSDQSIKELYLERADTKKNFTGNSKDRRSTYYDRCIHAFRELRKKKSQQDGKKFLKRLHSKKNNLPWMKKIKELYDEIFKNDKSINKSLSGVSQTVRTVSSKIVEDRFLKNFTSSNVEKTITYSKLNENTIADMVEHVQKEAAKTLDFSRVCFEGVVEVLIKSDKDLFKERSVELRTIIEFLELFLIDLQNCYDPSFTKKTGDELTREEQEEMVFKAYEHVITTEFLSCRLNYDREYITQHNYDKLQKKMSAIELYEIKILLASIFNVPLRSLSQSQLLSSIVRGTSNQAPQVQPLNNPLQIVPYDPRIEIRQDHNILNARLEMIGNQSIDVGEYASGRYDDVDDDMIGSYPGYDDGNDYSRQKGKGSAVASSSEQGVSIEVPANIVHDVPQKKQKKLKEKTPSMKIVPIQTSNRSVESVDQQLALIQKDFRSLSINTPIPRSLNSPVNRLIQQDLRNFVTINEPIEQAIAGDDSLTLKSLVDMGASPTSMSRSRPLQRPASPSSTRSEPINEPPIKKTKKKTKKPKSPTRKQRATPSSSRETPITITESDDEQYVSDEDYIEPNKINIAEGIKEAIRNKQLNFEDKLYYGVAHVLSQFSQDEIQNISNVSETMETDFEKKFSKLSQKQIQSQNNEIIASISTIMSLYLQYVKDGSPELSRFLSSNYKPIADFFQKDFSNSTGKIDFEKLLQHAAKLYFSFALKKLKTIQTFQQKFSKIQSFINQHILDEKDEKVSFQDEDKLFLMRKLLGKAVYEPREKVFSREEIIKSMKPIAEDLFEISKEQLEGTLRTGMNNQYTIEQTVKNMKDWIVDTYLTRNSEIIEKIVKNNLG